MSEQNEENKKLLFIVNPVAGKATMKNHLLKTAEIFQKAGYDISLRITLTPEDAGCYAANAKGYDRVVCAGGDGTLSEVVNGMVHASHQIPIGYIPCGTTNDFADTLGLAVPPAEAAAIAANGTPIACDVGKFNDRYFTYTAAFGLFSDVSYITPQKIKNVIGRAAYILNGAESILDVKPKYLHIEADGGVIPVDKFLFGMISNSRSVGGFKGIGGIKTELNDGLFEAVFVKMPTSPLDVQNIIKAFITHELIPEYGVYYSRVKHINIVAIEETPWTIDGDFGGSPAEATLDVLAGNVRYIANI